MDIKTFFAVWFLDSYTCAINFFNYVNSLNTQLRSKLLDNKVVYMGCMSHSDDDFAHVQVCDYETKSTLYILCAYVCYFFSPVFISVDDMDFALHDMTLRTCQDSLDSNNNFITVIYIKDGKKYYMIRRLHNHIDDAHEKIMVSNIGYAVLNYKNDITRHIINFNDSIRYTDMTLDQFAHILHFTFGCTLKSKNTLTVFDMDTFNEKVYKANDIIKV
jgi:hypothetical protein